MNDVSKFALGMILGGMMAIDMGGPFNKAAYVFGTAAITTGNYDIMAAVMIGGMVPPLAIALAAAIFKNKFTAEERKNAPVNYIMGLSFITEGAIPYAAADPLHVIPACFLGAALSGGLSMLFKCTLMAPARRHLRVRRGRQLAALSACLSGRHHAFHGFTRFIQKERFTKSLSFYSNKTRTENAS